MNIKSITILIILTLIFAAVFFYIYNLPSRIESVILTQDPSNMTEDIRLFTDKSKEIFVLIKLSKVRKDESIKVSWYKKDENKLLPVQNDNIKSINEGSGYIKLSLVSKNGKYDSGDYLVDIYFKGQKEKSLEFIIN